MNPKVNFTGNKWKDKLYRWHTGYPGGLKQRTAQEMLERQPQNILKKAILGMLSRNNLRHKYIEPRLKIYNGPNHPHQGQLGDATMGSGAEVLPKHPRKREGDFHYGFHDGAYASKGSYQHGKNKTK